MDILKSSISRKTLSAFLIIVIMTATFAIVSISISINVLTSQTRNYYDNTIRLLSKQLNDKLLRLENLAVILGNDTDIIASNQSKDNPKILWDYLETIKKTNYYSASNEIRNTTTVHMENKNRIISSTGRFANSGKYNNSDTYLKQGPTNEWVYRKLHNMRYCEGCGKDEHYTEFLSYLYQNNNISVCIDIDLSDIRSFINTINLTGDGVVFLVNSEGKAIFSTENFDIAFDDVYNKIQSELKKNGQFVVDDGDNKNRIIYTHSTSTPMLVGTFFNENQIVEPINNIRTLLYVSIAFTLIMSVVFTVISNKTIFKPLYILVNAMKNVKNGNFDVRIAEIKHDEMGFIYTQFNKMTSRIETLVNQVYLQDIRNKKSQLEFLQSQINPHFLFNSLNFIYQMSISKNYEAISSMSLHLGKYYQLSIASKKETIPLREELDNIQIYMNICMMKYPEKIEYFADIPENLQDLLIPKLIIQPIVENAFIHGHKQTTKNGRIWVNYEENDSAYILNINNNNSTLTDQEIIDLNLIVNQSIRDSGSYGIHNTLQRIKLFFGETASIKFCKTGQDITTVKLFIPKGGIDNV